MKILMATLLVSMSATAALKWEQQTLNVQVHPTQLTAPAVFHFSNVGKTPVSISSVKVSCGCLEPQVGKKILAPGERGELIIIFNLNNRLGPQKKSVMVKTDDGKETRLAIKTDIPKSYTVTPMLMKWAVDNPMPVKTARLTNTNPFPIQLISAVSSTEKVSVELKVIRAGFEYEVIVPRPVAGNNVRSVVRIKTEPPPGETKSKDLKLYVMAK